MHRQSRAVQPPWQKLGQKFACTGALFRNNDDDDGCRAMSDCDTTSKYELVQTNSESLPLHPLIPLPVLLWLLGIFEIFDLIITLQAQEDDAKQARRHSCSLFPLRMIRQLRIVFCLGLLMQSGFHALPVEHLLPMQNSLQCNKSKTKQRRSKNSRHVLPDPYCSMFNTSTYVRIPDKQMKAFSLHILGDGNCMWRAIAKSSNMKWYRLKRQVIRHIADQHSPDHLDDLKRISRRNAWGNYFALAATASFLRKDIRVFTTQAVIDISTAGSKGMINLALCNFHYSLMQNRSAEFLVSQCKTQFPQTLHYFLQQQSDLQHCIAHQQVYAQKNGSIKNYRCTKIQHSQAKTLYKQLAGMVAASKLPAYKPAGTPSGQRRPGEDFQSQVQRVAKARLAMPGGQAHMATGQVATKAPAKATEGRPFPKQPAGPPPSYLMKPAEPRGPPPQHVLRAALHERPPAPKAKPTPRPSTPRPSSAPGVLNRGGGIPASSSTEMPQGKASPGVVLPRNEGPPRVALQRLLIVSRGTRPECVQVTRRPAELQNPDWEVILKSLH